MWVPPELRITEDFGNGGRKYASIKSLFPGIPVMRVLTMETSPRGFWKGKMSRAIHWQLAALDLHESET